MSAVASMIASATAWSLSLEVGLVLRHGRDEVSRLGDLPSEGVELLNQRGEGFVDGLTLGLVD